MQYFVFFLVLLLQKGKKLYRKGPQILSTKTPTKLRLGVSDSVKENLRKNILYSKLSGWVVTVKRDEISRKKNEKK